MKADLTRATFDPTKHYSSVRMQQGRVQLDADWNEQLDITSHRVETETYDVVGRCGGPMDDAGFALTPKDGDLEISAGRYYVDGILCENEQAVMATAQPDLPPKAAIVTTGESNTVAFPPPAGVYVAYLEVWARHLTALEDTGIREVALGGPDTSTRAKTVWQVKFLRAGDAGTKVNCLSKLAGWDACIAPGTGMIAVRAEPDSKSTDPCIVAPGAGYRRLENQLYRVEVHNGGTRGKATFKWSRDNGSIVTKWEAQDVNKLTVSSSGRDKVLGFASGQWIELTDDSRELTCQLGTMVQITKVEGNIVTIDTATATGTTDRTKFPMNPKIRRWDCDGLLTPTNANWIDLEDGVQVSFTSGTFKTGDYWLVPARTATGNVEWPVDSTNQPLKEGPHGILRHYCRLGVLQFDGSKWLTPFQDCRRLFPPITKLTSFFYLGGDGQEVAPNPLDTSKLLPLPQSLRVGVANGQTPLKNASVRFVIKLGSGRLAATGSDVTVVTGADGVAACQWELDSKTASQQVEATLLNPAGESIHLPIDFDASLSTASEVSYDPKSCSNLSNAKNVQEAIDLLCSMTGGKEDGVHVKEIRLGDGSKLGNDSDVLVAQLLRGIQIVCDSPIEQDTVRARPTCSVTLEIPFPINSADQSLWGNSIIGFQPLILAADTNADNNIIYWIPSKLTAPWLQNRLFQQLAERKLAERVLARLKLQGNFIWSAKNRLLYLDGEVFGIRKQSGLNVPTELQFSSGNGQRGGDLDMWFYLRAKQATP